MIPINGQTMRDIAPRFSGALAESQAAIIAAVGAALQATLAEYDITDRLRIAHFLAQTCHESAGFRTTEEFASGGAYEGRADLGNTEPGDGRRFKGRGLLQITGRANYREYGEALGVDLVADPARAADPALSLRIACEYWKRRKINAACDRDDVVRVTKLINGGLNGLDDRSALTAKVKAVLARIEDAQPSGAAPAGGEAGEDRPALRRGSKGEDVARLQSLLRDLGFGVAIDGDFGPGTEVAVSRFQSERGLEADGIVGPATWSAFEKAPGRKAAA
jgi:putative chitinase